jgi:DNA-damage-inducible protein J
MTYNDYINKGGIAMVTVSLRFDDDMKMELDKMCDEMGMNLTTLFMIYAKKVLRDRKIPFEIAAPVDPFYSNDNMKQLTKSAQQIADGKVVVKTMEELEAMES